MHGSVQFAEFGDFLQVVAVRFARSGSERQQGQDGESPRSDRRISANLSRAASSRLAACSSKARASGVSCANSVDPSDRPYRPSILSRTKSRLGTPAWL